MISCLYNADSRYSSIISSSLSSPLSPLQFWRAALLGLCTPTAKIYFQTLDGLVPILGIIVAQNSKADPSGTSARTCGLPALPDSARLLQPIGMAFPHLNFVLRERVGAQRWVTEEQLVTGRFDQRWSAEMAARL